MIGLNGLVGSISKTGFWPGSLIGDFGLQEERRLLLLDHGPVRYVENAFVRNIGRIVWH